MRPALGLDSRKRCGVHRFSQALSCLEQVRVRTHKAFTPLVALVCAACVTTRSVAPHNVRFADRLTLTSERPILLRGTLLDNRQSAFDCPLLSVKGIVTGVAGDSIWVSPIASRTLAADAPGECGSVDEGVLVLSDTSGVQLSRAEMDGAVAAVTVIAVVVILGAALVSSGGGIRFVPDPVPPYLVHR